MINKILALVVVLAFYVNVFSLHVVGGEITYTYVSGNTYEVTLIVYRDNTSGGAAFDDPATLHLYSPSGTYIQSYNFALSNPSTAGNLIPNPYPNPCLTPPSNIQIQKGIYTHNITVPNGALPYELMYGRCCRNPIINNLTTPDAQGSMFSVRIPPTVTYQNNTPTFDLDPPIFICLGSALDQDQSATDIDGDSLFYRVCEPLTALGGMSPIVLPGDVPPAGFGPPFDPITWLPPYNVNDQLGGTPLSIDGNTGLVSGIPNSIGTFVVGICVEEYRAGVLLSRVLRDFQYTVTTCNIPTAAIPIVGSIDVTDLPFVPSIPATILGIYTKNCENLVVDFDNESTLPGGVPATDANADFWWDFGDGSATSTDFEPTHTFADTGTYVVTLAIIQGAGTSQPCTDTGYYVVYVFPIFTPDFIFDNSCENITSHFIDISTTASYDSTIEWDWDFGDGSAHSIIQNPDHNYISSGSYDVIMFARTEKGCTKLDTNTIIIYSSPIADFVNPGPICIDGIENFVSLSTIGTGTIDSTYWELGNSVIAFSDSFNTYNTSGTFPIQLVIASNFGCLDSITKNLVVNDLPNITITGGDTICPNSSVQVFATGGVSYEWDPWYITNNAFVSNPLLTPITAGYVNVTVADAIGCTSVDSVYIGFLPLPPAYAGEDTSVCLNLADLSVYNPSVPLQSSGGVSYVWDFTTTLDNINISNPIATPVISEEYVVTVTDTNNCTNRDTVQVIVLDPSFELIQIVADSICFGDTTAVSVIDVGNNTIYSWNPVTYVSNPNINEPYFFPPNTTEYFLTIQNYCYSDIDSITIDVVAIHNFDIGQLDSICLGETYQLNTSPSTIYDIYQWTSTANSFSDANIASPTIQPTITATYYLSVVDLVGTLACTDIDSVDILVNNNPTLNISTPINYLGYICQGDSVLLTANSNDAILYTWNTDTSLTSTNTPTTIAFPTDTNEYFITVENIHTCTTIDSITINVQTPINPELIGDSILCRGLYLDLEAKGGLYYHWYPSEANFSNENYSITQASLDTNIQIFVEISNDCFIDTLSKFITVNELPVVDAGLDKFIIRDDFSTTLDGSGDGKPLWFTEDYNFSGILNSPAQYVPEAQPFVTTTYVLEIENPVTGCVNYDTMVVNVEILTLLAFPTGFSPNGDGVNDFAQIIKHLNIKSLDDFSIYNRYGELIFVTSDFKTHWDGTYKGTPQEVGVYAWVIRATTKDNEPVMRKGNISLVK